MKMCSGCPWRKNSAKGWLGAADPKSFIDGINAEQKLPCHCKVDYDDPNWKDKLDDADHCVGTLIAARRMCKIPRDPDHAKAIKDVTEGYENHLHPFGEFEDHHNSALAKSWESSFDDTLKEECDLL